MKAINKYMKASGLLLAALTFGACSDSWDDHYDVAGGSAGNGASLWENIASNKDLSNFARVLDACGYKTSLAGDQMFTVFAPTNDGLSEEMANQLIATYQQEKGAGVIEKDNSTIKEFVQNHIALYNHSVAVEGSDTSIVMMNGKYLALGPNNFAGNQLVSKNLLTKNGILFTVGTTAQYLPNVFEYLGKDAALDSLSAFLYSYNNYKFDPAQSVPGEIIDGETTYLDSVKVLENDLLDQYMGEINDEDSTFWMVVPNNEQWKTRLAELQAYFNYDNKVADRDSLSRLYSHLFIANGSVFSMSYNTETSFRDSAYAINAHPASVREQLYGFKDAKPYVYDNPKPYEPGGVFYGAETVECSNGKVLKVPSWNIEPSKTFLRRIKVEAESAANRKEYDETSSQIPNIVTVTADNTQFYNQLSGNKYLEVLSRSKDGKPSITYYIRNVFSNVPYDIKVVMAPALAGDTAATEDQRKLLLVDATIGYNKQNGEETTASLVKRVECKKDMVDTLVVAENYVFPTCSYDVDPQVTLKIASSGRPPGSKKDQYQTSLRIDCIILEPKIAKEEK